MLRRSFAIALSVSALAAAKPAKGTSAPAEKAEPPAQTQTPVAAQPLRNVSTFLEGVMHKDFYYRTLRFGFQPWERFSFFAERSDYQSVLASDYNRNAVGANWHLPTFHERFGIVLSGAVNLANGTRQWVPVTDLAFFVKFRLFWRLHIFAQTRNYFYRNAVLDESAAGLRVEQLFFRGLNIAAAFPMSGYLFRGEPWQIGYGSLKVEYAYFF